MQRKMIIQQFNILLDQEVSLNSQKIIELEVEAGIGNKYKSK